jgi:hypothetical protein
MPTSLQSKARIFSPKSKKFGASAHINGTSVSGVYFPPKLPKATVSWLNRRWACLVKAELTGDGQITLRYPCGDTSKHAPGQFIYYNAKEAPHAQSIDLTLVAIGGAAD